MKTNKELTCIWPNLARACEIAMVGNLTVNIIYDTISYPEMPEDFELIKSYYKEIKFEKTADLTVVLCNPQIANGSGEKWEDVKIRAGLVEVKDLELDRTAEQLFKSIAERFKISISKRELILKVSNIIACMDSEKALAAWHVAESFQWAGLQIETTEQSVFSSLDKSKVKDFIDILTDEQVEQVNKYAHKIYNGYKRD